MRRLSLLAIAAVLSAPAQAAPARTSLRPAAPAATGNAPIPQAMMSMTSTSTDTTLSVGAGRLVNLPRAMADLFVADDKVADVQVKSPTQLYIFGKSGGETTVSATDRAGNVVWTSTVRVGTNIGSLAQMLKIAMPDSDIRVTVMNGLVLLTGNVSSPGEIEEAQRLAQALAGEGAQVVTRLKTPVPLQVNLSVRIAEVSRDLAKQIGVNLLSRDTSGGFLFGISRGNPGTISTVQPGDPLGRVAGSTGYSFAPKAGSTMLGAAGKFMGLDILSTLDLAETDGLVSTLAEPNLTAISGETASFLAGGEIPVPLAQGLGAVSVEYKQYGVSLSFTPTVFSDGRISLRVRPEVSQLSSAGSVTVSGFTIPGITTRRVETTIELGSGQSFMIGGLLSNNTNNSTDKAPFLGDLPILGALFRSNNFRRQQTELVVIITPYLVRPVAAGSIALPTDGYRAPTDGERLLLGKSASGKSGARAPRPMLSTPTFSDRTGSADAAIAGPTAATSAALAKASGPGGATITNVLRPVVK
ncbi:type II and III secretion system protein family protein [Sphingomonas naphthae]|uniref:Type II and III secretion system protein family protein n=1 Tax=Sphingomonas naphthae TaxID=1813468 RepID=A0ABY7TGT1_9SPHN|nr:type II and III secretion system protein family protein [Sphingomonas naphthae]WCT72150.1 type II and III secretion system protein family protein [Sphingomonas naphthae]